MKKIYFPFLSFLLLILDFRLFCIFPILAYDPVTIDQTIQGPPVGTGKDQDFYTNQPTLKCTVPLTISQTFDPILSGTDKNGSPVYQTQTITQIQDTLNFNTNDPKYSTLELDQTGDHLSNLVNHPLIPGSVKTAFLSLDRSNPDGASGMERSLPPNILNCLRSKRMVNTILSRFQPDKPSLYQDGQIYWNCPSQGPDPILPFQNQPAPSADCTPIRLSDIGFRLSGDTLFYDPRVITSCYDSLPDPTTLNAILTFPAKFHPNPLSHAQAVALFSVINVTDNGSLASTVQTTGDPTNSNKTVRLIPHVAIITSDYDTGLSNNFIPYGQQITNHNICQTGTDPKTSLNQPLPFSLAVVVKGLNEVVTNVSRTISRQTTQIVSFEPKMQTGINIEQTMLNDLIPLNQQNEKGTNSSNGSSTNSDGNVIDPGNSAARATLAKDLLSPNF